MSFRLTFNALPLLRVKEEKLNFDEKKLTGVEFGREVGSDGIVGIEATCRKYAEARDGRGEAMDNWECGCRSCEW